MFRLQVLILLSVNLTIAFSKGCELMVDKELSGIFIQEFAQNRLILNVDGGFISIAEGATIQGYCNSGFNNLIPQDHLLANRKYVNATFLCQNGQIFFLSSTNLIGIQSNSTLRCYDNQAAFYIGPIDNCNQLGLIYGVKIDGIFTVFAEVCYNMANMKVQFIHFVVGKRSSLLEQQVAMNPNNITYQLQNEQSLSMHDTNSAEQNNLLQQSIEQNLKRFIRVALYEFEALIPLERYAGRLKYLTKSFETINNVPIWMILRTENWNLLQKIIETMATEVNIDIFVGTSDIVQFPANDGCYAMKNLTYKVGTHGYDGIPLQIWQYIRPRDSSYADVVIVGINSPFLSSGAIQNELKGTDICDEISWLQPIKESRRMPALGYVYCLTPKDATQFLHGFPEFK